MQSCPKSIETRLQSIFPDAMLSGTSRTAWHRAFTCTMLSQEHQGEFGQDYFLCNVVWNFSENIVWAFTCALLSQEYSDNIKQDFFLCNVVWSHSDNIAQDFDLYNVIPRVLRQHRTEFFLMQCCLEPLSQYSIGFLAVKCCPNSIKTTLHGIFSDAMLFGASRTT